MAIPSSDTVAISGASEWRRRFKPNKPDPLQTARGIAAMQPAFWQHPGALWAPKRYELQKTGGQPVRKRYREQAELKVGNCQAIKEGIRYRNSK